MHDLEALLSGATWDQLEPLVSLMDTNLCRYPSSEEVVSGIKWLHRNFFESVSCEISGESESYAAVLCTLLKRLGVLPCSTTNCEALEEQLIRKVFEDMWRTFTATQRLQYEEALGTNLNHLGKSREWVQVGGLAGAMTAATLGGFGTYLFASSALHSLASIAGFTLPFGLYKSVSSAMSVALGPVGWLGLSIFGLYKLSGTNYKKLIPVAVYIALLRHELAVRPNKVVGRTVIPNNYAQKRGLRLG